MFLAASRTNTAVLCLLMLTTRIVGGTITVVDTGERFASRQDEDYGPSLWKDYPYAGRLQMIDGNRPLCPPAAADDNDDDKTAKTHRLVIPSDGLPVALLAQDGTCSRLEKLNYIRKYVEPAHLVHYLILDGDTSEHHHHKHKHLKAPSSLEGTLLLEPFVMGEDQRNEGDSAVDTVEKRDETIPIHVLHVSLRSEYKLLDLLLRQSPGLKAEGGPRLAIDSKVNTNRISDNIALAVAALTLLAACSCSLGLLIHGNRSGWWEPPPPPPPVPRRNRRRLRREQVREMLPVYRFNGSELEVIPEETVSTTALDDDGCPCEGPPRVPPLLPAELDCCSICLDDYEEGDRIRVIDPCSHTYHSKCIGKWLVERSATCPLCKLDLYESEDEEEEEEEGERAQGERGVMNTNPENAGITHFQAQLPLQVLEQQQQEEAPSRPLLFWPFAGRMNEESGNEQEPAVTALEELQEGDETQEVTRDPRPRRGWWQRLWRRSEPVLVSLTEPLLDEQQQEAPPADVETPLVEVEVEEEAPDPVESETTAPEAVITISTSVEATGDTPDNE